jgi:uncharacterized protein YdhG (YjbR/CyaY superfamily)
MDELSAVDQYILSFPKEVQRRLIEVRELIRSTAPAATESMAYGMPAYKLNGKPLVYFAAFKNHFGLYALPSGHAAFAEELSKYKQGKGSVQFPFSEELPLDFIARIVAFRIQENQSKGK